MPELIQAGSIELDSRSNIVPAGSFALDRAEVVPAGSFELDKIPSFNQDVVGQTAKDIWEGVKATPETAATLATGAIAFPMSLVGGTAKAITTGKLTKGVESARQIGEAFTYQPRGEIAQKAVSIAMTPFEWYNTAKDYYVNKIETKFGEEMAAGSDLAFDAALLVIPGLKGLWKRARAKGVTPQKFVEQHIEEIKKAEPVVEKPVLRPAEVPVEKPQVIEAKSIELDKPGVGITEPTKLITPIKELVEEAKPELAVKTPARTIEDIRRDLTDAIEEVREKEISEPPKAEIIPAESIKLDEIIPEPAKGVGKEPTTEPIIKLSRTLPPEAEKYVESKAVNGVVTLYRGVKKGGEKGTGRYWTTDKSVAKWYAEVEGGVGAERIDEIKIPVDVAKRYFFNLEGRPGRAKGSDIFEMPVGESAKGVKKEPTHSYYLDEVERLLDEVKGGEPGRRVIQGYGKDMEAFGISSTYPDFMRNKGWGKNEIINALEKGIKGEKLAKRQQQIFDAALNQAKGDFRIQLNIAQKGKEGTFEAWKLNKGDRIKVQGEVLKVTEATPERTVVKDGQEYILGPEDTIKGKLLSPLLKPVGKETFGLTAEKAPEPPILPPKQLDLIKVRPKVPTTGIQVKGEIPEMELISKMKEAEARKAQGILFKEYKESPLLKEGGFIKFGAEEKPKPIVLTPESKDVSLAEFPLTTLHVADRHSYLKPTIESTIGAEQTTNKWIHDYSQKVEDVFNKVERPGIFGRIFGRKGTSIQDVDLMIEGKKPVPGNLKGFTEEMKGVYGDIKGEIITKMKRDVTKSLSPKQQEYLKFKLEGGEKPKHVRPGTITAVDDMLTQFKEMENWGIQDYFPHIFKGQYKYLNEKGGIIASGQTAKLAKANFEEWIGKNPDAQNQQFVFINDFYDLATVRKELNPDLVNHLEYLGTKLPRKEFFSLIGKTERLIKEEIKKAGIDDVKGIKVDMSGIATLQPGRKFSTHFLKRRTQLRGEEADPFKATMAYIFSVGRKLGLEDAKKQAYYFADSLPPNFPNAKKYIKMQADNMAGRYNIVDEIVDKTIGRKMGAKPFLASRTMRRGLGLETKLKLGYAPAKTTINRIGGAMHIIVKEGAGNYLKGRNLIAKKDPDVVNFIKEKKHLVGVKQPFGAESTSPWGIKSQELSRWKPMGFYQRVEVLKNRPEAMAAGYVTGLKKFPGDKVAAQKYAIDSARLTQGLYETTAKPVIVRGPIIGGTYQFKQYLNNEIRFMSQLTPGQWAKYIPGIIAIGGTRGALLTIKSIIGISIVGTGIDQAAEWLNKKQPHLHRGIFGLVGVDVSAPATWQIPNQVRDWLGPFFNDAIKTGQMLNNGLKNNGWTDEEINDYVKQIAPVGYNLIKGLQLLSTGETKEGEKLMYQGKKAEGIVNLLGAKSVGQARTSDTIRFINQQKANLQGKYDVLTDKLLRSKNPTEITEIFNKMIELKEPQTSEEVKDMIQGIVQKAKAATLTEEARIFLTMPKTVKRSELKKAINQ